MMSPPTHVVEEVKRIDRDLRIRWSLEKRKFVVEKKIDPQYKYLLPKPIVYRRDGYGKVIEVKLPEDSERYISYHDGYLPVLTVSKADSRLPKILRMHDAQRVGLKVALRQMDERERKKEEAEERRDAELIKDIAGESYDTLHWRQGERSFVSWGQ